MRTIVFLLAIACLYTSLPPTGVGNPFSSEIHNSQPHERQITNKSPSYRGYALLEGHAYAIVQIGERQYIVGVGDTIGDIRLIEISASRLKYTTDNQLHILHINSPNARQHHLTPKKRPQ